MTTITLNVPGISCGHCVTAITNAVLAVAGVETVDVSVEGKTVTITGDADSAAVETAIVEAGYEIDR